MNKYEVACYLSHIKTLKNLFRKNLDYVLILEDDVIFDYFDYKKDTLLFLLDELKKQQEECIQLSNIIQRKYFNNFVNSKKLLIKSYVSSAVAYLITKEGMKKILDNFENIKNINFADIIIFSLVNNFMTKPYFSYPFLKNDNEYNPSFIRENNKSAHVVQTISKQLWDEYYLSQK